jgi:hypothetical protein
LVCLCILFLQFERKDNLSSSQTPLYSLDWDFAGLRTFELNDSQLEAVHDCLSAVQLDGSSLRLIWGPPGTGKTKTISALLWSTLVKKHRTLTCAPTNTAVLEIASRVLVILESSSGSSGSGNKCFVSDVVLFGNEGRMSVDANLAKVFMDSRVRRLRECFKPSTGWTQCLSLMLPLLEHPLVQYDRYVDRINCQIKNVNEEFAMEIKKGLAKEKNKKLAKKIEELTERKNEKVQRIIEEKLTFKAYFMRNYKQLEEDLHKCVEIFCDDLPRSTTSEENFRIMKEASRSLAAFGKLVQDAPEEQLQILFKSDDERSWWWSLFKNLWTTLEDGVNFELKEARSSCQQKLKYLPVYFKLPEIFDTRSIEEFLLQKATSVLCTASSSYRMYWQQEAQPFHIVVLDEAAQLKECESLIPLQLPGVRHAVLIGDEHQLPAFVKSHVNFSFTLFV